MFIARLAFLLLALAAASGISAQGGGKKNGRPDAAPRPTPKATYTPTYFYEFSRPGFIYSEVKIEHGSDGVGTIWFKKDGAEEGYSDPIKLTPATLETIDQAYAALNFLDSTDDYQTKMDHSNMGNVTLVRKDRGKERKTVFNWSENKNAMALMDVYRAISNEYTWKFEILLARDTQPLLTPGLMDAIDQYILRNEISDPQHLVPFLIELSSDERLPLMARNHATRIVKKLTKK